MAKKSKRTPDGHKSHSHGPACVLFGCTKKTHKKASGPKNSQAPEEYMRPGWSRGANWSRSQRDQFPQGLPDEGGEW